MMRLAGAAMERPGAPSRCCNGELAGVPNAAMERSPEVSELRFISPELQWSGPTLPPGVAMESSPAFPTLQWSAHQRSRSCDVAHRGCNGELTDGVPVLR